MIQDGDIDAQIQAALNESVFDDYATMIIVRALGALIVAAILIYMVVHPLFMILYRTLQRKFPSFGNNAYLKKHKEMMRDKKDYEEYLEWVNKEGYEPAFKPASIKPLKR